MWEGKFTAKGKGELLQVLAPKQDCREEKMSTNAEISYAKPQHELKENAEQEIKSVHKWDTPQVLQCVSYLRRSNIFQQETVA